MNFRITPLKEYDMNLFLETLDTLYFSIIGLTVRSIRAYTNAQEYSKAYVVEETYEGNEVPEIEKNIPQEDREITEIPTFKTIHEILKTPIQNSVVGYVKNTPMYVGNTAVPMYRNPTIAFDACIRTIPYGEMVMMLEPRGRFYKIIWNEIEGWVLRDDLVENSVQVYPKFVIGEEQSVDHPNTARVRTVLGDIFGLQRSNFPLQAGEYILYKLWEKGIHITWNEVRPRVPGLWHKILKGSRGIHVGVVPKVGSIMEYMLHDDMGHLAYVEVVFPDDTIIISESNFPDSGIYNERELLKEEWKAVKPVFITVV